MTKGTQRIFALMLLVTLLLPMVTQIAYASGNVQFESPNQSQESPTDPPPSSPETPPEARDPENTKPGNPKNKYKDPNRPTWEQPDDPNDPSDPNDPNNPSEPSTPNTPTISSGDAPTMDLSEYGIIGVGHVAEKDRFTQLIQAPSIDGYIQADPNSITPGKKDGLQENFTVEENKTSDQEILGDINEFQQKFAGMNDENTNEDSPFILMSQYMKTLILLDWMSTHYWSNYEYAVPLKKYSLIDLPLDAANTKHPVAVGDGTLFKQAHELLDEISEKARNDATGKWFPSSTGKINNRDTYFLMPSGGIDSMLGTNWISIYEQEKEAAESGGESVLADNRVYNRVLRNIMENFIDAGILYTFAKLEQPDLADNVTYKDLFDEYGKISSWALLDTSGGDTLDDKNIIKEIKTKHQEAIQPYLNLYADVLSYYYKWSIKGLRDYTFKDANGKETTYLGWGRDPNDTENGAIDNPGRWGSEVLLGLNNQNMPTASEVEQPGSYQDHQIEDIDTNNGAFGMLVEGGHIVDGEIKIDVDKDNPDLTDIGYALLAAGAVYDPFISVAGNDAWLAVVKGFLKEESKIDDVAQVLQVALNTKKPLYVTDGTLTSWSVEDKIPDMESADYRYAYLKDLLQIDEDVTRAYVTMKGSMAPSKVDMSTWEYVNKNPDIGKDNTTNSVHVETGNQTGEVATDSSAANSATEDKSLLEKAGDAAIDKVKEFLTTLGAGIVSASDYQVTNPVLLTSGCKPKWWGKESIGYASSVGGLTSLIIENARLDTKDNTYIQNCRTEQVFINGLGDIVLQNGVVILPAIANPVLYEYTSPVIDKDGDEFLKAVEKATDYKAYYPYTASFMNHYPAARVTADGKLAVDSGCDDNKYMLILDADTSDKSKKVWDKNILYAKKIVDTAKNGNQARLSAYGSIRCASIIPNCFRVEDDINSSYSIISVARGDGGVTWKNWLQSTLDLTAFSLDGGVANLNGIFKPFENAGDVVGEGQAEGVWERMHMAFVAKGAAYTGNGMSFFPLNDDSPETRDTYVEIGGPIANSALRYISYNNLSNDSKSSDGTFRIKSYIYDFVGEGLLGTQFTAALVKNSQVSYDQLVDDQSGRLTKLMIQVTDTAAETLGKIDGVLSIKGPYDNMFFNEIFRFIQDFYLLIVVALLIVTASKFFKGHFNILYVVFVAFLCVAGFEVYANWLPTLVPQIYNFAVNDVIEDVVWSTTFYNAESYKDTYKNADNVDPDTGKLQPYTGTITLYQLTNAEMREVAARCNIDVKQLRKGTTVSLDSEAGIFVQGNLIKMSIDRLLVNNSMRGLYKSQWDLLGDEYIERDLMLEVIEAYNGNPYSIQLTKPLVSLESYYTPYDHFERAFMSQLNMFANYFLVERNMIPYGNGELYKDAFMVNAYTNSGLFTAPGDRETLKRNIRIDTVTALVTNPADAFADGNVDALLDEIEKKFNSQEDWLGLVKVFAEPDVGIQHSMWGWMMQNREWYDGNWKRTSYGDKKLTDLILYINNHTKLWVINNLENIQSMSDENAIKMISLYATTCFTHYMSEVGHWLYPNYINAADIELKDVLYGSMVKLKDKNFAYDGTVVNTVGLNIGFFGVLFLLFIIILSALFILAVTYMVPILYAMFGCIIIYKMVNTYDKVGVVKGYVKVTISSAVLYFLFSLSLKLVGLSGYRWYSYLLCMLCIFLCCYFLAWIVISVVTNPLEMGNDVLVKNLLRGMDKLTLGAVSKMSAKIGNITSKNGTNIHSRVAYQYSRNYSVDNYDRPHGRRTSINGDYDLSAPTRYGGRTSTPGYGRNDTYYDDIGSSGASRNEGTSRRRRGWRSHINH